MSPSDALVLDKPDITARAGLLDAEKHGVPIRDTTETGSHTATEKIAINVGPRFRKIRPRSNMINDLRAKINVTVLSWATHRDRRPAHDRALHRVRERHFRRPAGQCP